MAAATAVLLVTACGDGGGDDLEDRLVDVLDVGDAEAVCPRVDDAAPGDRATCVVTPSEGDRLEVDIEFRDDGSFAVVRVEPA